MFTRVLEASLKGLPKPVFGFGRAAELAVNDRLCFTKAASSGIAGAGGMQVDGGRTLAAQKGA
jgi:hypothetical protein